MLKFIGKRLLMLIPVLIGVSLIVFTLMQLSPGDPAMIILGAQAAPEDIAILRESMGLNDPLIVQFFRFLLGMFTLDFGTSYKDGMPVLTKLLEALPYTAELTFCAVLLALIIGIPAGIISATKQYSIFDRIASVLALIGFSTPNFWLSIMLILVFSVNLKWLPVSGTGSILHLVLPSIALGVQSAAVFTRMTRSSMLEVLNMDYIRTARAKGLSERVVILKHALKNALIPVITVIGTQLGSCLGGAILTETVFAWPGVGRLILDAVNSRDIPMVTGCIVLKTITISIILLIVDLLYAVVDPRIRAQFVQGGK